MVADTWMVVVTRLCLCLGWLGNGGTLVEELLLDSAVTPGLVSAFPTSLVGLASDLATGLTMASGQENLGVAGDLPELQRVPGEDGTYSP